MGAVHVCLSYESQKREEEERRAFRNWEIIYSMLEAGKERWLAMNKYKHVIANWAEREDSSLSTSIFMCACVWEGKEKQKWTQEE